jgi:alpha-glucosidase
MKALTQGRYIGRDGEAALFDVGLGNTIAVRISKAISAASH